MGTSADRPVPRHLHYEILVGNYLAHEYRSYALRPVNVFMLASQRMSRSMPHAISVRADEPAVKSTELAPLPQSSMSHT